MITTIADQYLAQNAGRRYPFRDDVNLPVWLPDTAVLDFRCTARGVPAGIVPEARLTAIEAITPTTLQLTVTLSVGDETRTLQFPVRTDAAENTPYTTYAADDKTHAVLTVTPSALPKTGIPRPYNAEVEYLESTGTQWIDTGYRPNSITEFSIVYKPAYYGTTFRCVYGVQASTNDQRFYCVLSGSSAYKIQIGSTANGLTFFGFNTNGTITDTVNGDFSPDNRLVSVVVSNPQKRVVLNGVEYTMPNQWGVNLSCPHSLTLFGRRSGVAVQTANLFIGKIESCDISEAGVLVHGLIPVRFTNEQGVSEGAMYDRVSGELFRNQGTDVFRYGEDIKDSGDGEDADTLITTDIPFAATTVVCDSLKVRSLQSANSADAARDESDPATRDATAVLTGEIVLAEGRNAEPYLDGNRLRLDIYKGAGLGENCQAAATTQTCDNVLFTVNGERPGSDGDLRIAGDDGVTIIPKPEEHALEIRLDGTARDRIAAGCEPSCTGD